MNKLTPENAAREPDPTPAPPPNNSVYVNGITHIHQTHPEMTQLDEFAMHAPPPEPADICEMLGWEKELKVGDYSELNNNENTDEGETWKQDRHNTVLQKWHELPLAERVRITCEYHYIHARGMLEARKKFKH